LEQRRKWIDEIHAYFLQRKPFILLLIDGALPPQKIDLEFISALTEENLNFALILTKTDKANQKTLHQNIKLLKQALQKEM
jgi:probable GTP-binding protein engB